MHDARDQKFRQIFGYACITSDSPGENVIVSSLCELGERFMSEIAKILIIDDEPDLLELLEDILKLRVSAHISKANTALEALALCETENFDLVISDIRMAEMSGVEFLQNLRAKGSLIPVIFLSAFASKEAMFQAVRLGAVDFIEKPFEDSDIADAVLKHLEIHSRHKKQSSDGPNTADAKMVGLLKVARSKVKI